MCEWLRQLAYALSLRFKSRARLEAGAFEPLGAVAIEVVSTEFAVSGRFCHQVVSDLEVLVRGYIHAVVIVRGLEKIARHARSYARENFISDLLRYLALLECKIGALDQARGQW